MSSDKENQSDSADRLVKEIIEKQNQNGAATNADEQKTPYGSTPKPDNNKPDENLQYDEEAPDKEWDVSVSDVDFDAPLLNCLSLLANLHQNPVSKKSLKQGLPNADVDFTPAIFIRAAERAGFASKLVSRKSLKDISPLVLPCIILLDNKNACILLRFDRRKKHVEIMPAEGDGATKKVKIDSLEKHYTGYAILSKPTAKLDKRAHYIELKDRKDWFWGTLLKFWKVYTHVLIASLVINCFAIATPLFVMNVYDRVVPNNAVETLWVLAAGVGLVYLFEFILKNLRSYFVDVAGRNADIIMGSKLLEHVLGMRLDQLPPSIGSMANNLKDFEGLRDFFSSGTVTLIVDIPFMFLFLGVIWLVAGPVAYIPMAMIPIVLLISWLIQIPLVRVVERIHAESNQKYALLFETLSGLETIKSHTGESQIQGFWERIITKTATSSAESRTWSALASSFTGLAMQFTNVMVIIYGVYLITDGEMTMGALIAATMLSGRALAPLGSVAALLTRYQTTKMGLRALDELMKKPAERDASRSFISLKNIRGAIEFKNVSFNYPNSDQKALHEVSLQIRPGEKVGILGRIGSGKSTLGRLITGLYEPTEGNILLDGTSIGQIDPADVRQSIGYVSQDNYLFYGSVRDNIAFGSANLNEEAIRKAAKISGTMDFIRQSNFGLDLPVGERGMALSGGQRQSIAIARALVNDPNILLFDEPTSDMDLASENRFIHRLEQLMMDKTLLLITHRHSVLKLVKRIIILERGQIIADGPKDEVIEQLKSGQISAPEK